MQLLPIGKPTNNVVKLSSAWTVCVLQDMDRMTYGIHFVVSMPEHQAEIADSEDDMRVHP